MSTLLLFLAFSLFSFSVVDAEDPQLFFNWTVSYSLQSPLGVAKKVIVINDQFPGPVMNLTTNNVVEVTIFNKLDEPFLMTWNGVLMRRNSWNDGVQGTNCPILPGQSWTYTFQVKDQIGSFFYFPSLGFQAAAGGYGPIRINNRIVIPIPFDFPHDDFDIMIGDWYNMDFQDMRASLDQGHALPKPDGILINSLPPYKANFTFQPGATYRLRISNVGLKTSLNFRIQGHKMLLIETEGSYTVKQYYSSLDIHVGQSFSVLVTANRPKKSYYMVASSRFVSKILYGVAYVQYGGSNRIRTGRLPLGPSLYNYDYSMEQARSIRWDLAVGAARPNPQGSFHYGLIKITRTIVLQNGIAIENNQVRFTINGISFIYPDTPLKLADYFKIPNVFTIGEDIDQPTKRTPTLGTPVIDAYYHDFIEVVFQNNQSSIQTWHLDGYNFFVVGMEWGMWTPTLRSTYNMVDAIYRSTVQVYPLSWTAVLISLDNLGMWNLRSQDIEKRYLGQEVYMRVRGENLNAIPDPRDEIPIPANIIRCGRAKMS
ncbi:L-ascorbate oxidase homolog [Typha angustifolia]|uniref:L-ascorbate oxidase homolog n=1 Tax=Typha angustifolia TaxID=59011 RepID=UPI003C2C195E